MYKRVTFIAYLLLVANHRPHLLEVGRICLLTLALHYYIPKYLKWQFLKLVQIQVMLYFYVMLSLLHSSIYSVLIFVWFQPEKVDLVIAHFEGKEVSSLVLVERTVLSRVVQCLKYSLIIGKPFFLLLIFLGILITKWEKRYLLLAF